MKKLVFLLSLLFCVFHSNAQLGFCQNDSTWWGKITVYDTIDFEQTHSSIGHLIIDTTFPDNIWQLGTVQKIGFPSAHSGVNALQTDTLSPYPINNESVAIAYADTSFMWGNYDRSFSLCFWHYYDVDSLKDTLKLQMTLDSGITWLDYYQYGDNWGGGVSNQTHYVGSLNNYGNQNYQDSILYWTGNSGGWERECLCNYMFGVKGQTFSRNYGLRFYFHSDSIQTNKPGWMIDDMVFKRPTFFGAIHENTFQSASIFPNPSSNGIFNIDYPLHYVKGSLEIFNVFGQSIKKLSLNPSINLQDIPRGVYHYSIFFENTAQHFGGTLVYE